MPTYVTHDEGIINVAKIDFESQSSVEIDADNGQLKIEGENVIINSTDNSAAGDVRIDSVGVLELNSSGGVIGIGNDAVAQNINIGTGAAARTVNIGNATGATALALTSGTGGVALSSTDTGTDAIQLNASSGGVDIDAATTKDVNISGGQVFLSSKDNAASAIDLTTNVGTSETITVTNTQGTGADAITLNAAAGGVDIDATTGKDVNISGGQVFLSSKDNAASAIDLTTNVGTSETIAITNTKGTGADAIKLNAAAGGITLTGDITHTPDDESSPDSSNDKALIWETGGTIKKIAFSEICFLEGTKITLSDKKQINIEDLTLDDKVLTYNIDGLSELKDKTKISEWSSNSMKGSFSESGIRNIWINPTDSYLIINNKLRLTNHHLIHFKRNNVYYFNYAELLEIHDELLTDEGVYEPIVSIDTVKDTINVYNFELDKDQTYFADNYLVHHYCKLCSGYSNII